MEVLESVCYRISRRMVTRRRPGAAGENPATFDPTTYAGWRDVAQIEQFTKHFSADDLRDKDVLEFGCGQAGLSIFVTSLGAKSVTGVDANESLISFAKNRLRNMNLQVQPNFFKVKDLKTIDLPDASIDVVLCFDTLEHIMEYESIVREWHRVLRPHGRIFILWMPWWHPYGPHIESLVPIPWAHVFFSDRILIKTCARIYDLEEFRPRLWDLDESGKKKANKWVAMKSLPEVNRLTISRFEKVCRQVGLKEGRREILGFGGSFAARVTRALTRIPFLREFFCSYMVYDLYKPGIPLALPEAATAAGARARSRVL